MVQRVKYTYTNIPCFGVDEKLTIRNPTGSAPKMGMLGVSLIRYKWLVFLTFEGCSSYKIKIVFKLQCSSNCINKNKRYKVEPH